MGTIAPRVELADLNGRRILYIRRDYGHTYRRARSAHNALDQVGLQSTFLWPSLTS